MLYFKKYPPHRDGTSEMPDPLRILYSSIYCKSIYQMLTQHLVYVSRRRLYFCRIASLFFQKYIAFVHFAVFDRYSGYELVSV